MKKLFFILLILTNLNTFAQYPVPTIVETHVPNEVGIVVGNEVLFIQNYTKELWKWDSLQVRSLVKSLDISSFINTVDLQNYIVHHNVLYFTITPHSNFGIEEYQVWRSDGTDTGTYILQSTTQQDQYFLGNSFAIVMDTLFFTGKDSIYEVVGNQLKGIIPDYSFPDQITGNLFSYKNYLFYYDFPNNDYYHAWNIISRNDTTLLPSWGTWFGTGSFAFHSHMYNDTLYFIDIYSWGEMLIAMAPDLSYQVIDSNLSVTYLLGTVNNKLILSGFRQSDSAKTQLYTYDLIQKSLSYIDPGTPYFFVSSLVYSDSTICYFAADDSIHGTEIWKTDGTLAGTMLVEDFTSGADFSSIQNGGVNMVDPVFNLVDKVYKCGPYLYFDYKQHSSVISNPGWFHVYDGTTISPQVIPNTDHYAENYFEFNGDVFFHLPDLTSLLPNIYKFTCGPSVKINDILTSPEFILSPNPSENTIEIRGYETGMTDCTIRIVDLTGKVLSTQLRKWKDSGLTLDVSYLISGLYFLKIENSNRRSVLKFVKE